VIQRTAKFYKDIKLTQSKHGTNMAPAGYKPAELQLQHVNANHHLSVECQCELCTLCQRQCHMLHWNVASKNKTQVSLRSFFET